MGAVKLGNALTKITKGNDAIQCVKVWLDTGFPPLNKAISDRYKGGFPVARMVEIAGPESSGKTLIATMAMKGAQQAGGIAIFQDHERSFDTVIANKYGLLTGPEDPWIFKTPDSFEESVHSVITTVQAIREQKLIEPEAPIVVVFDSLASMVPMSKLAKDVDAHGMNDKLALASATSAVFPVLAQHASDLNMLVIFLNQVRLKPGVMFGDPRTTTGGEAIKFYPSVRIMLSRSMIKNKDTKEVIGQEIKAQVIKNKVSAPFKEATWRYMFEANEAGHFFDMTGSLLDYMKEKGLIELDGNYFKWEGQKFNRGALIKKIDAEGTYDKLVAMLPEDD